MGKEKWIIETKHLTKRYGNLTAIDSLDLKVPYGAVGLLGPNGAGKSTLIKVLLGLLNPSQGSAKVLGYDIDDPDRGMSIRQRIGYMPESDCLIPDMDAVEFVKYMGELGGVPPMDALQRAHEILHYIGMGDERYRQIKTYSTGMKQKIKMAQALVHDPVLMFLDEPTNGMDPKGRLVMLDLIHDISANYKKNVIISSHLLPDIEYLCNYVVILNGGQLILQGGLEELTKSVDRYEIRIKGSQDEFSRLLTQAGIKYEISGTYFYINAQEGLLNRLYKILEGSGIQIRHAAEAKRSLEDIFVSNINQVRGVGKGGS
jgi:ABC-2 type transport system ATP-binding protein